MLIFDIITRQQYFDKPFVRLLRNLGKSEEPKPERRAPEDLIPH
jgi:hypothetical protein